MDLSNNLTFQWFYISCTFIGAALIGIIILFFRKKGVNLYKKNRILKIVFAVLPIFFLPIFLHPALSLRDKLEIVGLACMVAIINFFVVDRGGKKFRKWMGYETKWDKEEKAFAEKEKKEPKVL